MRDDAILWAVNFAILTAHRLGEPRVIELTHDQADGLRRCSKPTDWAPGAYRGLRIAEREGSAGRVLAWDRARETEMAQPIPWPSALG
ncbi:hypothetical protein [Phenylobacterium sp. J367]|uniref:hypothetical protein n=1 Tax=Phenylobacterium sp. J367 TaxID=2898435 RepID=UPI002151DDCD|nr:hypothetical protein [Phenylobacterium sp. J367]MCR5878926.1 hypothetical protein [Phenylobacterium sp. J367]